MSNELMPFAYEDAELRSFVVDGEPWFVAADVARILEYSTTAAMTRRLDDEDKGVRDLHTLGGVQQMTVISEPGFYAAILGSQSDRAKEVKRWLTHEVLPTLRKTGTYSTAPALTDDQLIHRALQISTQRVVQLAERVAELEPKAAGFDAFLNGEGLYLIGTVARMLGVGQTTMFRFLYEQRILISAGSRRTQPYADPKLEGWFRLRTHDQDRTNGRATTTTMVTPRGAEGIRLLAVEKGLIEPQLIALPSPTKEVTA